MQDGIFSRVFGFMRKRPEPMTIQVTEDGFLLTRQNKILKTYFWNTIQSIVAFKIDQFITDLICLEVSDGLQNELWTLDEEMEGWKELVDAMFKNLPGMDRSWYLTVMNPAFEINRTNVFQRGKDLMAEKVENSSGTVNPSEKPDAEGNEA